MKALKPVALPKVGTFLKVGSGFGVTLASIIIMYLDITRGIFIFMLTDLFFPVVGEIVDMLISIGEVILAVGGYYGGMLLGFIIWSIVVMIIKVRSRP